MGLLSGHEINDLYITTYGGWAIEDDQLATPVMHGNPLHSLSVSSVVGQRAR